MVRHFGLASRSSRQWFFRAPREMPRTIRSKSRPAASVIVSRFFHGDHRC